MAERIAAVLERRADDPGRFEALARLLDDPRNRIELEDYLEAAIRRESGDVAARMYAHARFYAELVRREGERLQGPEQLTVIEELIQQFPQILRAIDTALGRGEAKLLVVFTKYLAQPLIVKSRFKEGAALFEQLLSKSKLLDNRALEVIAGLHYGQFLYYLGRYDEASKLLEHAAAGAMAENDEDSLAQAMTFRGLIAQDRDAVAEAAQYYAQALAIYRRLGVNNDVAVTLDHLSYVALRQYRYTDARKLLMEAMDIMRGVGNLRVNLSLQNTLGVVALTEGNLTEAQQEYEKAFQFAERIGDLRAVAATLNNLSDVCNRLGKYTEAEKYCRRAIQIFQMTGYRWGEEHALNTLAGSLWNQGRFAEVKKHLSASLAIARELDDRSMIASALHGQALVAGITGEYDEALQLLEECIAISQEIGQTEFLGKHYENQAGVYYALHDYDRAESSAKRALAAFREIGNKQCIAHALCELAYIRTRNGSVSDAASLLVEALKTAKPLEGTYEISMLHTASRILSAADRGGSSAVMLYGMRHRIAVSGSILSPDGTEELEEGLGNLAALLPSVELARLITRAEAMSLEELAEYALKALEEVRAELGSAEPGEPDTAGQA